MTVYYPIVLETEASGAVSAYVPACRCMPRQPVTQEPNAPFEPC